MSRTRVRSADDPMVMTGSWVKVFSITAATVCAPSGAKGRMPVRMMNIMTAMEKT
eukprot:CAMPEP_0115543390 /NCGR_PEP_ID=MMETSP0271-20121206/91527_1 /TAXON_ID=71861 /ORGANISM="Scrippsiella trochoidea, Strain CCMP3099" /LENGTH=54 /DNA_ID=CAMNT_0002976631 /DNA_START=12 /DNA_END=172 /DNA_ORIENTATION=+